MAHNLDVAPLPIDAFLPAIRDEIVTRGSLVLEAEPGSGKTTRVPPSLLDTGGGGSVWVLEPRRLAARAAARWVARERGCELGAEIGYQVRHDRRAGDATRLRFVTDGVLLRRLLRDPFLTGIGTVVLDEFHERHVEGDLLLAMLREVRETVRPDLRLVVMSATLEAAPLVDFLGAAHVVVAGASHPVTTRWSERADDRPLALRVREAVQEVLAETPGDVLVFLPGKREIDDCARELTALARREALLVLPLHGNLSTEEQDVAVATQPQRKVVLATNVAESSITIAGITAVVDSGLARILRHDPARGLDVLALSRISLASAAQRRGRAGRTAPGVCARLWTRGEERHLAQHEIPELLRIDLAGPVLSVRKFAARAPAHFGWFEAPDAASLAHADRLLGLLGAVDAAGRVTARGDAMLALPLHPRLARIVLAGHERGCPFEAAGLAALLAERDLVRDAGVVGEDESGPLARLRLLEEAQAVRFAPEACRRLGIDPAAARAIARAQRQIAGHARPAATLGERDLALALLAGFPDRVARRSQVHRDEAALARGGTLRIRPGTLPHGAEIFLALDLAQRRHAGAGRTTVSLALPLERAWLDETGLLQTRDEAVLDSDTGRVRLLRRLCYLDLVLEEKPAGEPTPAQALPLLAPLLRKDPWRWLGEQRDLRSALARLAWLRGMHADVTVPELDDGMIADLALELGDGRSLAALRDAPLLPLIFARWPGLAAVLEREAPERLRLPSGRFAPIDYAREAGPTVSARLQEFFGARDVPRLAGGRVPVVLELLAPNMRPVQVTRDLPSFWDTIYPRIRSELRRRYPKHAWPDDPWTAKPQSRPGR